MSKRRSNSGDGDDAADQGQTIGREGFFSMDDVPSF